MKRFSFRRSREASTDGVSNGVARPSRPLPFSFTLLRLILFTCNFLKWAAACIVMAIVSYYIHDFPPRNQHLTYQEIIACLSIGFYLPTIPAAFVTRVRGHLIPLDIVFSHLWVTALIFAAQDYSATGNCRAYSPPGTGGCRLKYAIESWCIIAFSLTIISAVLQALVWRAEYRVGVTSNDHVHEKSLIRPSGETAATAEQAEPIEVTA